MINTSQVLPGQLVVSKAGRDFGRYFVIIEIIDDQFVHLVDGDLRKVEKPKKKKIKHLQKTNHVSQFIVDKIDNGEKITNVMVRREIEKLNLESNLG
ncbi:MAG: KOW domain-containing RNA-binding protein [Clostridiales bacterium]|nr:KOW domain-containing RNA-binding protein [Clostridiales bacterium]